MTLSHVLTGVALMQSHPAGQIDSIVRSGVLDGVYPSAVVVVGTSDSVLLKRGIGSMTWEPGNPPDPDSTLYDLASLTKVVATASGLLVLVDQGAISLDAPLATYVPDFRGRDKERVTVRHVLTHRSGLRAFLPLHTSTTDATSARHRVVTEELRWPVGSRVEYSDLNSMLAGWAIEQASGQRLSDFVRDAVFDPLGMTRTQYGVPVEDRRWAAPINLWRGHPISGVVHDQNAERFGGVSGHAGVYSTGMDVARLSQWYLRRGRTAEGIQLVSGSVMDEFTTRGDRNRALGWEMKDPSSADNSGELLAARSFGHTGFTGTSVWIDPSQDVFVVLLTNRVMAPRHPRSIAALKGIRGQVADAAVRLRWYACRIEQMVSEDRVCVDGPAR